MAKIKKTTLDAGEINLDPANSIVDNFESETDYVEMKVPTDDIVVMKTKVIDKDIQNKLDSYAQLEAQNAILLKEKNELEARLAEYIEENALLKNAPKTDATANESELANLKDEIANLKQSIAQYLRRISDLTFENANLTVQLKELSSKKTGVQNSIPSIPSHETHLEQPVYNPYKQNGYSSWN